MRTISHAPTKKSPLAASTSAIHARPRFPVSGISDSTPLALINTAPRTKQTTVRMAHTAPTVDIRREWIIVYPDRFP